MIIIYDFDGTLTPYPLPNYEILAKCGYDGNSIMIDVKRIMQENSIDLYSAYYRAFKEILENNGIPFKKESICLGANKVEFNKGVLEYFERICYRVSGIRNYVITSGLEDFIRETAIASCLDDVLGTNFQIINGLYGDVKRLMSNDCKVKAIDDIVKKNNSSLDNIIYFGDGLTDMDAFKYIHDNGGKAVLVCECAKDSEVYKNLNSLGIIDECFELDYSVDSKLYKYINSLENNKER